MTGLNLDCRNLPEALEKPLLFIKRFGALKALPWTPSHFIVAAALWGGPDCVGQMRKSRFKGVSGVAPGHRELVTGRRLS